MKAVNERSNVDAADAVRLAAERAANLFLTPRRPKRERVPPVGSTPLEIPTRVGILRGWAVGTGPRVLCVHGWEGDSIQFKPWVGPLQEAGLSVAALDFPAHGSSEGQTASAVKFAHALMEVVPALGALAGVIAHSLGGGAVGIALSEGLRVPRACLLAPVAEPMPFARAIGQALNLDAVTFAAFVRRTEQLVGRSFDSLDIPVLLARSSAEVLVLHDPADAEVPYSHGQRYAEQLPSARLVPLEAAGHRPIVEDPRAIAEAVRFLAPASAAAVGAHG